MTLSSSLKRVLASALVFAAALSFSSLSAVTKSELQKMYLTYMKGEGFKCELDDDGDVKFKRDGNNYYVMIDEKDPTFFRIVRQIKTIGDDNQLMSKSLLAADVVTSKMKVARVVHMSKAAWISTEVFVPTPEDFSRVIDKCFTWIDKGYNAYFEKMNE